MPDDFRSKHRLVWKDREVNRVVARAVLLRQERPTLSLVDALYAAQEGTIDVARRKQRFTTHFRRVMVERLTQAELGLDVAVLPAEERHAEQQQEQAAAHSPADLGETPAVAPAAPVDNAPPVADPLVALVEAAIPVRDAPLASMCREFGSALGAALADGLGSMFAAAMQQAMQAQLTVMRETMSQMRPPPPRPFIPGDTAQPEPPPRDYGDLPEKFHTHKVAIVGLQQAQQNTIRQTFPHLDFRMLDNGANATQVKKVSAVCEATFLMTKFISHHTQGGAPREKRIMVNGGVTDLTRVIRNHFPRSTSMEATH